MTAPRDPDVLIRAFLDEGQTDLPDRAFDAVRSDIHETRQRVVIGPWREPNMSIFARVAIAAVAVLAVGLAWVNFGPAWNGIATQPTPTPSPTASPKTIGGTRPLEPGRYQLSGVVLSGGVPISLTVPAGWSSWASVAVNKNYNALAGPALMYWEITNTFVDPCTNHTLVDPAPGADVDSLIDALASMPGTEAGPPTDVTIDGYRGKYVEVTVTTDINNCGTDGFWLWMSPGDSHYVQDTNEMDRIYVLDVDSDRLTFAARFSPRTTPADRAELEAIIASIDIEP
jgi:hypothetical protein